MIQLLKFSKRQILKVVYSLRKEYYKNYDEKLKKDLEEAKNLVRKLNSHIEKFSKLEELRKEQRLILKRNKEDYILLLKSLPVEVKRDILNSTGMIIFIIVCLWIAFN